MSGSPHGEADHRETLFHYCAAVHLPTTSLPRPGVAFEEWNYILANSETLFLEGDIVRLSPEKFLNSPEFRFKLKKISCISLDYFRDKKENEWHGHHAVKVRLFRKGAEGNFLAPLIALSSHLKGGPFISHTLSSSLFSFHLFMGCPASQAPAPCLWLFLIWLIVNNDPEMTILFSTGLTVLCNERFGLPSYH